MLKRPYFLLIIIQFIFSGCYTIGTVEIEVIRPAKIKIPSKINSLALINNSILYPSSTFKNETQKGLFILDTTSAQSLIGQVYNIINESPRFDTSILINDIYFRNSGNLLQPINWNDVEAICRTNNVDALLSLEAFEIDNSIKKISYFDGYGFVEYKSLQLIVKSMWRLYSSKDKVLVDKHINRDTLFVDQITSEHGFNKAVQQQRAIDYFANEIALFSAVKVADRLAPYWQPVVRNFYIYESNEMRTAAKLAYADDWKNAAIIWNNLTKNENARLAAAASYNMALVCEVQGRLDIAKIWLEQSLELYSSSMALRYLQNISYRIKEEQKLNKQFGIE